MTKSFLRLDVDSYEETTREPNPDDDWDRGDTRTSWTINGPVLEEKDSAYALPVEDVSVGDMVYCLYAIYSTGDTFGRDEASEFELISVHKTEELARKNLNSISFRKKESDFTMKVELDNGEIIERYCPWDGYFESLDHLDIMGATVK